MMLSDMLIKVAKEFVYARGEPFADHSLGKFVRHDLAEEARKRLIFLPYDYKVKGSVGAGVWAAVPWLGIFDPLITTSATRGFYVVYLINPQTETIFLSLNQGTTAVYREHGEKEGREVLSRRAQDLRQRAKTYLKDLDTTSIDLGSNSALPAGYEAGHAFGKAYSADQIDSAEFEEDFETMLSAYEHLISSGGTTPVEILEDDAGTNDVVEAKRYHLSKRIERAPNVRPRVLKLRGLQCECCGFTPSMHLNFHSAADDIALEVHHAKPIYFMAEGETRRYRIPDDFLVLCPTCHRLIHQQEDPSDLQKLKSKINFQLKKK